MSSSRITSSFRRAGSYSWKMFIGSAMMDREGMTGEDRIRLVGLISLDGRALAGGAHLVDYNDPTVHRDSVGHVTAVCFSPSLGKYIGLALVKGGKARHGSRLHISDPLRNRYGPVEVVSHHMFDPEGKRIA